MSIPSNRFKSTRNITPGVALNTDKLSFQGGIERLRLHQFYVVETVISINVAHQTMYLMHYFCRSVFLLNL